MHLGREGTHNARAGPHAGGRALPPIGHGILGGVALSSTRNGPITKVLKEAAGGDPAASSRLLELVYRDLKRLASARLARIPPGGTLQPTVLVHDAYLRIMGGAGDRAPEYENRRHFFFAAARAMRDLVAEHARRKARLKRDAGPRIVLDTEAVVTAPRPDAVLDLHRAMERIEKDHPDWARVALLRFYAGLSPEETAEVIGVSLRTVERRWTCARAWLRRELAADVPADT